MTLEEFEEVKDCNKDCNCCDNCNCGDDCHCTPDNKCCDECTCDEHCTCGCNADKCDCETDTCKGEDDDSACKCEADDSDCKCKCEDDDSDCKCECEDEDNECIEVEEDAQDVLDEDKCQCGCGEKLEESTADAYFKQLLSLRAEFDNYRKRTQNDIAKAYSNGFNQAITEFLPALDSFKMAAEYITDPNTLMGIQYIEKGILNTLEKIGVKVIDVSGKFDPNFHQAIGSELSAEHESGDIIKECFKGFTMGDKVIRYSQVVVCK